MARIEQHIIDQIDALPIAEVIKVYTGEVFNSNKLTKCPIHKDTNPSFSISEQRNCFYCFGCQSGGGPVQFVMAYTGFSWIEAVKSLADNFNIPLGEEGETPTLTEEEQHKMERITRLGQVMQIAQSIMHHTLCTSTDPLVTKVRAYCTQRFGNPAAEGTAAHTHLLGTAGYDFAQRLYDAKVTQSEAEELGLLGKQKKGYAYSPYIGRVVFSICNPGGRVVGFSGRIVEATLKEGYKARAKYINSPDSLLFTKGRHLFGFPHAGGVAKREGWAFLVEGYADALRLHGLGFYNTFALMGTALTGTQTSLLAQYTNHVIIIPDTDEPGIKSTLAQGTQLQKEGVSVSVLPLPLRKDGEKNDADTFFTSKEQVGQHRQKYARPFSVWQLEEVLSRSGQGSDQGMLLSTCRMIAHHLYNLSPEQRALLLPLLERTHGGEPLWSALLRNEEAQALNNARDDHPKLNKAEEGFLLMYGITSSQHKKRLYKKSKEGILRAVSNFRVIPRYFVRGVGGQGLRLIQIENIVGAKASVELPLTGNALRGAHDTRLYFARFGNFSFYGSNADVVGLSSLINGGCIDCEELAHLGYHPARGLYVWSNGVYSIKEGKYIPFAETGVVKVGERHYYLAAANKHGGSTELYASLQPFKMRLGHVTGIEYFTLFCSVYGNNGKLGLLYLLGALFRDVIFKETGMYPILNAFGPPMTGKSQLGRSLMALFFENPLPLNLPNSTMVSLSSTLQWYQNAVVGFDEYRNDLRADRLEFLKSAYDGGGRAKSVAVEGSNMRVSSSSEVLSAIYLSGQQIPEADVALFTRVILLNFEGSRFTIEARQRLKKLQNYEREGLSHIIHSILNYRGLIVEEFPHQYRECCTHIELEMNKRKVTVDTRTVGTWGVLYTMFTLLAKPLSLPFTQEEAWKLVCDGLLNQHTSQRGLDDVTQFWEVFSALVQMGELAVGYDFLVEPLTEPLYNEQGQSVAPAGVMVLYFNSSSVINSYRHWARNYIENPLTPGTLHSYLKKSPGYLANRVSKRYRVRTTYKSPIRTETNKGQNFLGEESTGDKNFVAKSYAFTLDALPIEWSMENSEGWKTQPAPKKDLQGPAPLYHAKDRKDTPLPLPDKNNTFNDPFD